MFPIYFFINILFSSAKVVLKIYPVTPDDFQLGFSPFRTDTINLTKSNPLLAFQH